MRPAVDVPPKLLTAIHGLSRKSLLFSGWKTIEGESTVAPPSIDRLTRIKFSPVKKSEPVAAKVLRKILPSKSIPATGSVARVYGPPVTMVRLGISARVQVRPQSWVTE